MALPDAPSEACCHRRAQMIDCSAADFPAHFVIATDADDEHVNAAAVCQVIAVLGMAHVPITHGWISGNAGDSSGLHAVPWTHTRCMSILLHNTEQLLSFASYLVVSMQSARCEPPLGVGDVS